MMDNNKHPAEMIREYLQEWRNEHACANKNGMKPDFNWHLHDKELIAIQGALRKEYEAYTTEGETSLTVQEKEEVERILRCVIND